MDVSAVVADYRKGMNMVAKNVQPVSGAEVLAALDRRLAELDARRAEITAEILTLERSPSRPSPSGGAAELLLQGEPFEVDRVPALSRLQVLHSEREAIDRAVHLGRQRQLRLQLDRAAEVTATFADEIGKIEKRRVLLALELQALDRKREELREKIRAAGGAPTLPTDNYDFLGIGDRHDEVREAAERLIEDGIMTEAEVRSGRRG
jgi:prefoldin subunit 5